MAHTIVGKLNADANTFQAGDSTGFGIRLGVKYRDPKTKQDDWTNYRAVIFAKSPGQIQFYQSALVAGSVIEVSADQLKIDSFEGQNGTMLSLEMINAKLGYVHSASNGQNAQQQAPQQQQQRPQQQQQRPQQQGGYQNQQQQQYQPQQQQQGGYQQQQQDNDGWGDIPF
jgi:single-stranded DNA-binding protein